MNEEEIVVHPQPESGIPAVGAEGVVGAEVSAPAPEGVPAEVPTEVPLTVEAPVLAVPGEETAQMGGNEPFAPGEQTASPEASTVVAEILAPAEMVSATPPAKTPPTPPHPAEVPVVTPAITTPPRNPIRELFAKAQSAIQFRKRKKLDRIMNLFAKQTSITNDDVEKLLHVSDATATRYLAELERMGRVKQTKKAGRGVQYMKVG